MPHNKIVSLTRTYLHDMTFHVVQYMIWWKENLLTNDNYNYYYGSYKYKSMYTMIQVSSTSLPYLGDVLLLGTSKKRQLVQLQTLELLSVPTTNVEYSHRSHN